MGNCLNSCLPEPITPDDRKKNEKNGEHVRFFMTGLGSAGKTTIVRQLFLLCNKVSNYKVCNENWIEEKTKPDDNEMWVETIRKNILDSMDIFIKQLKQNEGSFADDKDRQFAQYIEEICEQGDEGIEELEPSTEFTESLLKLFESEPIQNVWKKRNTINVEGKKLSDGCDHFINSKKIREVFAENYVATDEDKVHSRKPTTDMSTYRFKINNMRIEINDVGGQRSELVKIVDYLSQWSFHEGDPRSNFILLVVSMSDFNVKHPEYEGTLLDECVEYMKVLLNNKLMDPDCREDIQYLTPFLNKKQIENFQRGRFNEQEMQKALADKFTEAIKMFKDRERDSYCKYTCAVDSRMMEGIFNAIKEDFINSSLFDTLP
ncbi:Guanine nucleotide-binding protein G(k) subunit alpha [Aphelenchoides fujianensis]|nr:Guanine nucleotide-binding protein G(k) subunit alpha [Aphelenchoides fujianensis]